MWPEVEHQANGRVGGYKVIDQLYFVNPADLFHRLEFQYDLALHDYIGKEVADDFPVVKNLDGRFDDKRQPGFLQFHGHGLLVDRFQKSRAEGVVHPKRATDYFLREWVFHHTPYAPRS